MITLLSSIHHFGFIEFNRFDPQHRIQSLVKRYLVSREEYV
ncbi:hypothetical protein [Acinetobacter guerrae]|nr:hypothetical protein [Acinetobacter guerrae]